MTSDRRSTGLAELLTNLRQDAGLSMYELAKRTGINRSTLMRIEDGTTTNPDTGTLNTIALGLGVEPELLYDAMWQDTETPLPSPAVYFRSKYRLSPQQIAEIERSIERMADRTDGEPDHQRKTSPERRSP